MDCGHSVKGAPLASLRAIELAMQEAQRVHASVPHGSWSVLKCAVRELRAGRKFVARLSVVRRAIQSAMADLERAIQRARVAIVVAGVSVNRTFNFLYGRRGGQPGLRVYAQLKQWRNYDRLLACIRDHPSAVAARILLYWL
jgi:hypothetical protein